MSYKIVLKKSGLNGESFTTCNFDSVIILINNQAGFCLTFFPFKATPLGYNYELSKRYILCNLQVIFSKI
jgi:hypothetical protein